MRNKRKGILMAAAILGSAAIVSTGFAAWVITVDQSATVNGNIEVDTVDDESILLTEYSTNDNYVRVDTVKFGAGQNNLGVANKGWLDVDAEAEVLEAVFYIKVSGSTYLNSTTPFTFELTENNTNTYATASGDTYKYVLPLTTIGSDVNNDGTDYGIDYEKVDSVTGDDAFGNSNVLYKVSVTFGWGDYFNRLNPTNYYNAYEYDTLRSATAEPANALNGSTTLIEDVKAVLMGGDTKSSGAYKALASAKFKLTIKPNRDA